MGRRIRLLAAFAVAGLALTACGADDGGDQAAGPTTTPPSDDRATDATVPVSSEVNIVTLTYERADTAVDVGGGIRWTNHDGVPHTVTADDGAFDSGRIAPGEDFTTAITVPGNYTYRCEIHPRMLGTVTVK